MSIDLEALRQLAGDAQNLAVLAVTRADGTVHASLVSAGVIDRPPDGQPSIGVVVAGNAVKLRHLRRARRATAVFHAGYRWVAVEGGVAMAGPDDAGLVASEAVAELLRTVSWLQAVRTRTGPSSTGSWRRSAASPCSSQPNA